MDFQFKSTPILDACDPTIEENEYSLELKFTTLSLTDKEIKKVQLMFLYGDLLSKMEVDVPENEGSELGCEPKVYTIHSTPNALAEKFQTVPIIFTLINVEDQKVLASPIILEVAECFCNSVKCVDFKQQSLRKTIDLELKGACVGKISFIFTVIKDIGNSNRFRKFYTQSTAERVKMQSKMPKDL